MIIDASDTVLGRVATSVAKHALLGENVRVVNCEKALISGTKRAVVANMRKRLQLGQPQQGPYFTTKPGMLVRRVIRGMLPYKTDRGRTAFSRVKCYVGVPVQFEKEKAERVKSAHGLDSLNARYVRVSEICKILGGNK